MNKNPYPKCIVKGCRKRAKRWDGGQYHYVIKDHRMKPGIAVWLCLDHDPQHRHYDLPGTLEGAIRDIVALRAQLQEEVKRNFKSWPLRS